MTEVTHGENEIVITNEDSLVLTNIIQDIKNNPINKDKMSRDGSRPVNIQLSKNDQDLPED